MSWEITFLLILGSLLAFMALGVPVAFAFIAVNILGAFLLWNGLDGISQLVLNMYSSVAVFSLAPVPLFILMGEVMFHSGVALRMMDTLEKWMGRVPGRLSLLSVGGGTLFATLSGSSMATTAMLGSILVPEMKKRGYHNSMAIGPILGSGTLASMIPPTALGVLLATLSQISVGKFLLAIIMPGILMALVFAAYIMVRCKLQPHLAPLYETGKITWGEKIRDAVRYILPLGLIIFLVIGVIVLGIATPNEAAALGALGTFVLAFAYNKKDSWELIIRKSLEGTLKVTGMMLMIVAGSTAFSQILAYSGATQALVEIATNISIPPIGILIVMQLILIIMGMFMEPLSILMVTLPLFIPIATALDFNLIWFATIILVNMEMAAITPPFGMSLFVMKGILPPETKMLEVYRAGFPFVLCDAVVMALMIIFPQISLWLTGGA
ncbi:MAG: TRAP transporter large permease [Carboxydocellales bacterium]